MEEEEKEKVKDEWRSQVETETRRRQRNGGYEIEHRRGEVADAQATYRRSDMQFRAQKTASLLRDPRILFPGPLQSPSDTVSGNATASGHRIIATG